MDEHGDIKWVQAELRKSQDEFFTIWNLCLREGRRGEDCQSDARKILASFEAALPGGLRGIDATPIGIGALRHGVTVMRDTLLELRPEWMSKDIASEKWRSRT